MNIDCRSLTLYRYTHLHPSNRYSVICHTMQRKKDSKVKQDLRCAAYKALSEKDWPPRLQSLAVEVHVFMFYFRPNS